MLGERSWNMFSRMLFRILTLRAPAEAISVLGEPKAKYFGCRKDMMVFRVGCYQACYMINPSGGKVLHTK